MFVRPLYVDDGDIPGFLDLGVMAGSRLDVQRFRNRFAAMGDAGLPREGGRQDLDLLAIIDGALIAIEVKTRYRSRRAGQITRAGNLRRPRLRRPRSAAGDRQGSQAYVTDRLAASVDTGDGYEGVDVGRVWITANRDLPVVRGAILAILPPLDQLERELAGDGDDNPQG